MREVSPPSSRPPLPPFPICSCSFPHACSFLQPPLKRPFVVSTTNRYREKRIVVDARGPVAWFERGARPGSPRRPLLFVVRAVF